MKGSKKILAAFVAALMVVGSALPVLATDAGSTTSTTAASGTQVQITKTLKIGRGITVPDETFQFEFATATTAEAEELGEKGSYIIEGNGAAGGVTYPNLNNLNAKVTSSASWRTPDGTDTGLTFLSEVLDMTESSLTWPVPGLYIYSVKEVKPDTLTPGMEYDDTVYFLKVFVVNGDNGCTVSHVNVWGKNEEDNWVKINGAPTDEEETWTTDNNDGSEDFVGNDFKFVNKYEKLVDKHPTNQNETSGDDPNLEFNDGAFKITKDVSGNYANQEYGFCFQVTIHLPETNSNYTPITALINGYTAHVNGLGEFADYATEDEVPLEKDKMYQIYLKHGNSFIINELPAGATIDIVEEATEMKYIPSFVGRWGDISVERKGTGQKATEFTAPTVVVGENGAYLQFTNTLNDADVTTTGIIINNLPYIMMVGIGLAGICFFMISKKRRSA